MSPQAYNDRGSHADEAVRAYYHRVLPFFEQELADRGDAELWTWAASTPSGCRVLELGAGTGRATAFLARTAGRVVAFDLSPELIAVARRRLSGMANVALLAADMREVAFKSRFDLVVAVDDPFVHLTQDEDRDRALATAARHLASGGRFIIDAAWLSPEQRRTAALPDGLALERSGRGALEVREVWHCDAETRVCSASFEYRLRDKPVERVSFPARLWSTDELEERARAAGLRIAHLWGDYDRRPWDRATSRRLIAELRARD
ncbi:MAG TPA: class I SAM-dependent methyltransferase [Thermoanaerobaculia bacterium]|jgi:SAM-dependent methyltransferase|nr:class I SAM-dependent methyltransferase [Thermoanaerobaculia bacterium]